MNGAIHQLARNESSTTKTVTNRRSPSQFTRSLIEELNEACKLMREIEGRFVLHSNILNSKDEIELIRHEITQYQKRIDVLGKRIHIKK